MSTPQPNAIFHNPATGEIPCTGDDKSDAWRSDEPLDEALLEPFASRDPAEDTLQPGNGGPLKAQAELDDDGYLAVTGVPVGEWEEPREE